MSVKCQTRSYKLTEVELHLYGAILILLSAIVPIYLSIRLKKDQLRVLIITLGTFTIIHSLYHIFGILGLDLFAEGVFQPLSIVVLIIFGIIYLNGRNLGVPAHER